jgi:hypothetical protein
MYAVVSADQFDLVEGSIIHLPTGAEFTPTSPYAESRLAWTGTLERLMLDGRIFKYDEVLAAARAYWLAFAGEPLAVVA